MVEAIGHYVVEWSEEAKAELRTVRSFSRLPIERAVAELRYGAESTTRNRKRLERGRGVPDSYPDPTWEVRVGEWRVLYGVEGRTVTIVRVILKGRRSTEGSL